MHLCLEELVVFGHAMKAWAMPEYAAEAAGARCVAEVEMCTRD